jgi:ribosomal protein S18 acetylase RimI-like enzyme
MRRIIKLNKNNAEELSEIDYESEHQGDRERNIRKKDMKKSILDRFKKKQEIFFGYKENKEIKGYATLKPFFPGYKHCELYWMAVKKKDQQKGIGRELLKFTESFARKKGFRKIFLYTGKDMKKTRKFYEKNKYKKINEFKGYYGYKTGNTTGILYGKELKK